MDPILGGLISGGASIIGGLMNTSSNQAINAANIQNQDYLNAQNWQHQLFLDTHHIQDLVGDARKAGISPLAALGVNTPSAPVSVGATQQASSAMGEGVARAGQDISEAFQKYASQDTKKRDLEMQLLQAQVDSARSDIVGKQLRNSQVARTFARPGSRSSEVPLPMARPAHLGELPLYQTYYDNYGDGSRVTLLSKDASEAVMNASSLPIAPVVGAGLVGRNVPNAWESLRPDISRFTGAWYDRMQPGVDVIPGP